MRDHEQDAKKDGALGAPPRKAKTGGEHERAHKRADGQAPARPDILSDERAAHPANAEPLAELLSRLQHSHGNAYVQRVVSEAGGEKAPEQKPAAESQAQGLDGGTRSLMESAFGESFGDVRVHTGGEAERLNEELGARAVTRGRDLYFDRGEYDPSTREGRELLAHELAHVVQQREETAAKPSGSVGRSGDVYEQEADRAAREVMAGGHATVLERGAAPASQRQAKEGAQQKQTAGAISLNTHPSGSLAGGASYTYDPSSQRLTITGPRGMSFSITSGGSLVSDSAATTMAPGRTRIVAIRVSGTTLMITVNGRPYTFVRR